MFEFHILWINYFVSPFVQIHKSQTNFMEFSEIDIFYDRYALLVLQNFLDFLVYRFSVFGRSGFDSRMSQPNFLSNNQDFFTFLFDFIYIQHVLT